MAQVFGTNARVLERRASKWQRIQVYLGEANLRNSRSFGANRRFDKDIKSKPNLQQITNRMDEKPLNIISLGAGVQSTVLALQSELGEPLKVDGAIFADTGGEPKSVYDHLDWIESQVSYPIHRVMWKDGLTKALHASAKDKTTRVGEALHSFFLDENGKKGMLRRGCTEEYKIKPIIRKIRELLGLKKGQRAGKEVRVIQWIGISYDEIQRMRDSKFPYIQNYYPFIDSKTTREDCLEWMKNKGYPEPSTICLYLLPLPF